MADEPVLEPGSVVAGHRVERFIAEGGMARVYEAVDLRLDRRVALKIIGGDEARDPGFSGRFVREARLLAGIDHPGVLPIYQAGADEGRLYLTMRLVSGGSLRDLFNRHGALPPADAFRLLAPVAAALDALHGERVLHRDVKPANILLDGPAGVEGVWLADFGLARRIDDGSITSSAERFGTFEYMAPEQWRADGVVGPAADVYAFGLVLYEALTGHRLDLVERNPPPALPVGEAASMSPGLHAVFRQALDRDPWRRHPSAGALLAAARAAVTAVPAVPELPASAGPVVPVVPGDAGRTGSPAGFTGNPGAGGPGGHAVPPAGGRDRMPAGPPAPATMVLAGAPVPEGASRDGAPGPTATPGVPGARRDAPGSLKSAPWGWVVATALAVAVAVLAVLVALDGDPAPSGQAAATPSVSVITRTPTAPPTSRRPPAAPPPRARPSATRSRVPGAGSTSRQDRRGRLTVCAESVSVRRDPRPEGETETVGTLRRGDTVTVLETNGNGWVRGRSAGSAVVTGWVLREFVKERCG